MHSELPRRQFLTAVAAGGVAATSWSANSAAQEPAGTSPSPVASGSSQKLAREVRLERLHPREIDEAMKSCPTLLQPLGTIEWHGLHNIVGLDAIKAHHLCQRAAQRGGGLVAPAVYGGVGGLDEPHTFVIEPENDVHSVLLRLAGKARPGSRAARISGRHFSDRALRRSPTNGRAGYRRSVEPRVGDPGTWHPRVFPRSGCRVLRRSRRLGRDRLDALPGRRQRGPVTTRHATAPRRRGP